MRRAAGIFILFFSIGARGALAQPVTSELRNGRWIDIAAPATNASPTAQPIDSELVRIEQLLDTHNYNQARRSAYAWVKANKDSPNFDRGLFITAQSLYGYGDRIKAFYYLDELLDDYPESDLYPRALQLQYRIADAFLNGYKRRFLKLPIFGASEEAIQILFRIQQRSPGSPLAQQALLRTADYYYADQDYDLAEDAYGVYAKNYPRSADIPRVRLRQAYANLAQFRGLRFDATPVVDARAQLQDMVSAYPDLAAQENIPAVLGRIQDTFARKLQVTANFYQRTHAPEAAAYTYNYLIQTYPDSPEAKQARSEMAKLGAAVVPVPQ